MYLLFIVLTVKLHVRSFVVLPILPSHAVTFFFKILDERNLYRISGTGHSTDILVKELW